METSGVTDSNVKETDLRSQRGITPDATNDPRSQWAEADEKHERADQESDQQHSEFLTDAGPSKSADQDTDEERNPSPAFIDPAPKTPRAASPSKAPEALIDVEDDGGPTPEIKNIMQQFEIEPSTNAAQETEQVHDVRSQPSQSPTFPLRGSSLQSDSSKVSPQDSGIAPGHGTLSEEESMFSSDSQTTATLPVRVSSLPSNSSQESARLKNPTSPPPIVPLPKEMPLTPDPEPDLPFDFHRFLEQLRHRTADPVAKYVRSFLNEFGKKPWTAPEQVKFIHDFLAFIANKMSQCEVWRGVSDAEFENAKEGMEKLVMNRLYSQTFSPAIPPSPPISAAKGRKKNIEKLLATGRRGQHQEDIERDDILSQKVRIYSWVQEEHLDIKPINPGGRRFLSLAQQGNSCHSRDKLTTMSC